ncbi:DUF732 domain-containing protein [Kitasatospora camelliae]|uniref:DUF732 domain-containing protein n=1 Tax=Kitasatospora camelliae TaxID=3156397 RepID=A0AAU8JWG3_9ACTN
MRIRVVTTTLAAACVLALSACSSSGSGNGGTTTAAPQPVASTTASKPAASTGSAAAPAPAGVPTPSVAQKAGLMAAMKAVNPALATNEDATVALAMKTCADIKSGKDEATVAKNAVAQASTGSVVLTQEQGKLVATAVKAAFCPA